VEIINKKEPKTNKLLAINSRFLADVFGFVVS
jgi:hypothetical protein